MSKFFHFHVPFHSGQIDRQARVIRGVSVISGNIEAEGHGLFVDDKTLSQIANYATSRKKIRVQADHTGSDGKGFQSTVGWLQDFSVDRNQSKVKADLHLLESEPLTEKIMEMAEAMPENFGLSVAFKGAGESGPGGKKFARCEKLLSVDLVSSPAANPTGLFSAVRDRGGRFAPEGGDSPTPEQMKGAYGTAVRNAALVGASAAGTGAILGGGAAALQKGNSLRKVLKATGKGSLLVGGLAAGGTLAGSAIYGNPKEGEGAPLTKRASVGGAAVGALAGAGAGALVSPAISKLLRGIPALRGIRAASVATRLTVSKTAGTVRPASWVKKGGTPAAVGIGAAGGAGFVGATGADEASQVDTIRAALLEKERKMRGFSVLRRAVIQFEKRKNYATEGVVVGTGIGAVAGLRYMPGRKYVPGEDLTGKRVVKRVGWAIQHEGVGAGKKTISEIHNPTDKPASTRTVPAKVFKPTHVIDDAVDPKAATRAKRSSGKPFDYKWLGGAPKVGCASGNCQTYTEILKTGKRQPVSRQWRQIGIGAGAGLLTGAIAGLVQEKKKHSFCSGPACDCKPIKGQGLIQLLRRNKSKPKHQFSMTDNTPLAKTRYRKTIQDQDLDRRDSNILKAGIAGSLAGILAKSKRASLRTRALVGAGVGTAGVLGIRAATDSTKDQYGERSRGAKSIESLPALAGLGAAGYLAYKRLKPFAKFEALFSFKAKELIRLWKSELDARIQATEFIVEQDPEVYNEWRARGGSLPTIQF